MPGKRQELHRQGNEVLDFSVKRERLYRSDGNYTGKDVIFRDDGKEVKQLGFVDKNYQLVEHRDVMGFTGKVLEEIGGPYEMKSFVWNGGARMRTDIRFPEREFKVNGDSFHPALMVHNSYDAKQSFKWMFGLYRLVCENGMYIMKKGMQCRIIHKFDNVDLKKIGQDTSERLVALSDAGKSIYQKLLGADVNPYFVTFLAERYVTDRYKKMALEMAAKKGVIVERDENGKVQSISEDQGFTAYDLWNILTFIATHRTREGTVKEKMDNAIARVFTR